MKLTLYQIHDELAQLFEQMETVEPEKVEALGAKIQELELAWDEKLAGCCAYYKNLEAEATAIDEELDRLTQKRDAAVARLQRFKDYLAKFAPRTKWTNGVHSLGWRTTKAVEIQDEKAIPAAFKREVWKLEPDKKEIKMVLESGGEVPGAQLVEREHLQVK